MDLVLNFSQSKISVTAVEANLLHKLVLTYTEHKQYCAWIYRYLKLKLKNASKNLGFNYFMHLDFVFSTTFHSSLFCLYSLRATGTMDNQEDTASRTYQSNPLKAHAAGVNYTLNLTLHFLMHNSACFLGCHLEQEITKEDPAPNIWLPRPVKAYPVALNSTLCPRLNYLDNKLHLIHSRLLW